MIHRQPEPFAVHELNHGLLHDSWDTHHYPDRHDKKDVLQSLCRVTCALQKITDEHLLQDFIQPTYT